MRRGAALLLRQGAVLQQVRHHVLGRPPAQRAFLRHRGHAVSNGFCFTRGDAAAHGACHPNNKFLPRRKPFRVRSVPSLKPVAENKGTSFPPG